jgi:hypothetical protein
MVAFEIWLYISHMHSIFRPWPLSFWALFSSALPMGVLKLMRSLWLPLSSAHSSVDSKTWLADPWWRLSDGFPSRPSDRNSLSLFLLSFSRVELQHGLSLPIPQLACLRHRLRTPLRLLCGGPHVHAWEPSVFAGGNACYCKYSSYPMSNGKSPLTLPRKYDCLFGRYIFPSWSVWSHRAVL